LIPSVIAWPKEILGERAETLANDLIDGKSYVFL
jgi:hypothetical protein